MGLLLLGLIAAVSLSQEPLGPGAAMAERVSAQVEAATSELCDTALAETETRNAEGLFTGAGVCHRFEREGDAIFLQLAAQARARADMELSVPENPPTDESGAMDLSDIKPPAEALDLWAYIYGYGGGAGSSDFYRDEAATNRLFDRLRSWRPQRPSGYSPGWVGSRPTSDAAYSASVSANIEDRIQQLTPLARLYRDDAYFALQKEFEALLVANDYTFVEGTPAQDRYEDIRAAMTRRQEELGLAF
jgi:hypothetical protein